MNKTIQIVGKPHNQYFAGFIIVIAAVILGYLLFIASHAASPSASSEAESGNLSGSACKVTSTGASGGTTNNAVQFGGSSCGSTCTSNCGTPGHPLLGWGDGTWTQAEVTSDLKLISSNVTAQVMDVFNGTSNVTAYPSGSDPSTLTWLVAMGNNSASNGASATTYGQQLVANGHANAYIRIMWEFNGNWYPWGSMNASTFISDFKIIHDALAAVPGNHFTYVWDVNCPISSSTMSSYWPGSPYVTDIGMDDYGDTSCPSTVEAFAKQQGKPVELDEWGINGNDDPSFIDTISSFVHNTSNNVDLQSYFSDSPTYNASINSDIYQYSDVEAAYAKDFAGE